VPQFEILVLTRTGPSRSTSYCCARTDQERTMQSGKELLVRFYDRFNARDMEHDR
jgi:hypothetical protein